MLSGCDTLRRINTYDVEEGLIEKTLLSDNWEDVYDEKNAYYSNANSPLNIHKGPNTSFGVVDYMKPTDGGFIQECNFDLQWCYLSFGSAPKEGWVEMRYLVKGAMDFK